MYDLPYHRAALLETYVIIAMRKIVYYLPLNHIPKFCENTRFLRRIKTMNLKKKISAILLYSLIMRDILKIYI